MLQLQPSKIMPTLVKIILSKNRGQNNIQINIGLDNTQK